MNLDILNYISTGISISFCVYWFIQIVKCQNRLKEIGKLLTQAERLRDENSKLFEENYEKLRTIQQADPQDDLSGSN